MTARSKLGWVKSCVQFSHSFRRPDCFLIPGVDAALTCLCARKACCQFAAPADPVWRYLICPSARTTCASTKGESCATWGWAYFLPLTLTLARRESFSGEEELQEEVVILNELDDIHARLDANQKQHARALLLMSAIFVLVSLYVFM